MGPGVEAVSTTVLVQIMFERGEDRCIKHTSLSNRRSLQHFKAPASLSVTFLVPHHVERASDVQFADSFPSEVKSSSTHHSTPEFHRSRVCSTWTLKRWRD